MTTSGRPSVLYMLRIIGLIRYNGIILNDLDNLNV